MITLSSRRGQGSSVSIVTRLLAERPGYSSRQVQWWEYFSSPPRLAILHSPNTPSWRGSQLKHWDNFTIPALGLTQESIGYRGLFPLG